MRPFPFLCACLFVVGAAGPARSEGDRPKRTLAELIAIARRHSATVEAAAAQVPIREAQKSEAIRNWYPTGELNTILTIAPRVRCDVPFADQAQLATIITNNQAQGGADSNAARDFRQRNCINTVDPNSLDALGRPNTITTLSPNIGGVGLGINFRLTQPLYTFGKIEHGVRAARKGIEAEQARVEAARNEAELNVARAYWGLKSARTTRETLQEGREELVNRMGDVEKDLDSDKPKFTVIDLQRIKVAAAQVDLLIADVDRNIGIADAGLEAAIGEPSDIDDGELNPVEVVEHPLSFYQQAAVAGRPEVRALDAGVAALRELQKLKLSEMLPDLALVGGVDWRYAPSIEDAQSAFVNHANQFGFSFYLALHQPLDLFERHAKMVHARADADALAAQRLLALTGIGLEIARAYWDLVEARRRMELADKAQHIALGWLNAVRDNVQMGTADGRDLVEAARSYYELRLRYYLAIYDVNISTAVLRKASGVEIAR